MQCKLCELKDEFMLFELQAIHQLISTVVACLLGKADFVSDVVGNLGKTNKLAWPDFQLSYTVFLSHSKHASIIFPK